MPFDPDTFDPDTCETSDIEIKDPTVKVEVHAGEIKPLDDPEDAVKDPWSIMPPGWNNQALVLYSCCGSFCPEKQSRGSQCLQLCNCSS